MMVQAGSVSSFLQIMVLENDGLFTAKKEDEELKCYRLFFKIPLILRHIEASLTVLLRRKATFEPARDPCVRI